MDVILTVDDRQIQTYMQTIYSNLRDLRGFFVTIIPIIRRSIVANFRQGGRPKKWKALSPGTIAGREREKTWPGFGGAQPILQRHGFLFQSLTSEAITVMTRTTLMYGTNLEKAPALQEGRKEISGIANIKAHTRRNGAKVKAHSRKFRWGALPARPFILFQPYDIKLISSYAAAFAFNPKTARGITGGINRIDMSGGSNA